MFFGYQTYFDFCFRKQKTVLKNNYQTGPKLFGAFSAAVCKLLLLCPTNLSPVLQFCGLPCSFQ